MQLGSLIARLGSEDDAMSALQALGDIVLFARVRAMGERFDESPGDYVACTARRFAATAGDEDWLKVVSAIERSEDPASAALKTMIAWALATDDAVGCVTSECGCNGTSGGDHEHP